MLWGYPAAEAVGTQSWVSSIGWFGTTPEGNPAVNPIGNFLGAIIMFGVLGFLPTYVVARILQNAGILREPREVELAGADTYDDADNYPYFAGKETEFEEIERGHAK